MNLLRKKEQIEYEQTEFLLERLNIKSKDNGIDLLKANILGLFRLSTMVKWKSYSTTYVIKSLNDLIAKPSGNKSEEEKKADKESQEILVQEQLKIL
jgi:hypothetical protein